LDCAISYLVVAPYRSTEFLHVFPGLSDSTRSESPICCMEIRSPTPPRCGMPFDWIANVGPEVTRWNNGCMNRCKRAAGLRKKDCSSGHRISGFMANFQCCLGTLD